jgi:hypothetical protein
MGEKMVQVAKIRKVWLFGGVGEMGVALKLPDIF